MRSYDSLGDVITLDIPAADWDQFPAGDLNVRIGDFVGVTQGPVGDDGKLNLCVERVYNRTVTSAAAAGVGANVYLDETDGSLSTTEGDGVLFGRTLEAIAAGKTAEVRVKLIG